MATTKEVSKEQLFARQLGTDIVTVVVGKNEKAKKFSIHKSLLCQKVAPFDKMFNGSFIEGTTQSATLPDDDPEAFELFIGWLYHGIVESAKIAEHKGTCAMGSFVNIFVFAEKYTIGELADNAMNSFIGVMKEKNCLPCPANMQRGFNRTYETSKLRLFLARSWLFMTIGYTGPDPPNAPWANESIYKALVDSKDLGLAVIEMMRNQSGKVTMDPRTAPPCDYHQHSKDEPCPYSPKQMRSKRKLDKIQ